ncbi:U-box domain-containing protein 3 isoform X2 [Punica granatum]|uniref:RING-type E3 ubiquitin transferase n=1 Tax=Punica granatum TaxID=22663 RepID=A0A6P8C3V2_PUNGR|nr:U-box domain-containing protein 3 isoform X2 [Punica granatum]
MGTAVCGLINSISRFIHLVLCQTAFSVHLQPRYRKTMEILKLLKPVLDEVSEQKAPLNDRILCKECEELDVAVNEARELMENWSPKMSKISSVLQSEPVLMKIENSSFEICRIVSRLSPSSVSSSTLSMIEKLRPVKQDTVADLIEEVLRDLEHGRLSRSDTISKIIEMLDLKSNQGLLKESIAVEKERINAPTQEAGERCPLSLELMVDPVIVASGQTYERASIQKWFDHGLDICPKTYQPLTHKNLIPNYTVKAMVLSWCEQNSVRVSNSSDMQIPSGHGSPQEYKRADSFGFFRRNSSRCDPRRSDASCRSSGEEFGGQSSENENYDSLSVEKVSIHSRSESTSSLISSTDYLPQKSDGTPRYSGKPDNNPHIPLDQLSGSKASITNLPNGRLDFDNLTTESHVKKLVEDLHSQSKEAEAAAAEELRLLAKLNTENRILIGQCGAIPHLLSLLYSPVKHTQEHAVSAILNLSINEENKALIAGLGPIEPLVHALQSGNEAARENSAAALFSLSALGDFKAKIGRSGAVKALVDLLGSGTLRGKKDAATALFNLSIFHENKGRIVQAGAVRSLVQLMDPASGMAEKALALLANLSTVGEGRVAIVREGGIPLLVEAVESGSRRGKENAASVLLQLCLNNPRFCTLVLQEGAVPPLVALSQSGTPRAKEKAQQLLSHFRNQREAALAKGKS